MPMDIRILVVTMALLVGLRGSTLGQARPDTGKASPALGDTVKSLRLDALEHRMDSITSRSKGVIRFGVGVGYRRFVGDLDENKLYELSISPYDSTLQLDTLARFATLISAVVTAKPFARGWRRNLLFIANVNLAEFTGKEVATVNNKPIDGGIGIGFEFHDSFAVGLTLERWAKRVPRSFVIAHKNEKVPGPNGGFLTRISSDDETFFRDANLLAFGAWFVYRPK